MKNELKHTDREIKQLQPELRKARSAFPVNFVSRFCLTLDAFFRRNEHTTP